MYIPSGHLIPRLSHLRELSLLSVLFMLIVLIWKSRVSPEFMFSFSPVP